MYDRRFDLHPNLELDIDGYTNFIFRSIFGGALKPSSVNTALKNIVNNYNDKENILAEEENREPLLLPHITCHVLRHTFVTRLVENNVSIKTVQETAGHIDIQTTLSIYKHSSQEIKQKSFAELEGKFKIK